MRHKKYSFTVPDLSKAAGVSEDKIRRDIRSGKLCPDNIWKTSCYVVAKHLNGGDK